MFKWPKTENCSFSCLTKHNVRNCQEVFLQLCKCRKLFFFSIHPHPLNSLASNQPSHYPCWGLLMRHQTLFMEEKEEKKKKNQATLSKAVNVLSHISQAQELGIYLCGKALAGHGGTSIISACLPWVACVEITALINKQSPSVKIFIQTELHPCGGLSEHFSCTLKGYSESHIWAGIHLEINGVPLTGWVLSATGVH